MEREKILKYSAVLIPLIVAAFFFFRSSDPDNTKGFPWFKFGSPDEVIEENTEENISFQDAGQLYESPFEDFYFTLPYSFTISRIADAEGETLLFRGEDERRSFQIYILPLVEDVQIIPEKIRADLPSLDFREPQVISVDGVQAVVFLSTAGSLETREIWMAKGRNLYQISTYVEFDDDMVGILSNWKWVN